MVKIMPRLDSEQITEIVRRAEERRKYKPLLNAAQAKADRAYGRKKVLDRLIAHKGSFVSEEVLANILCANRKDLKSARISLGQTIWRLRTNGNVIEFDAAVGYRLVKKTP